MTTPAEMSRRQRLVELTHVIVATGIQILSESDTTSFTVQEIANRAPVSIHTLYRLFPTKDHLSLAIFEELNRTGTAAIAQLAATATTPLERLRLTIVAPLLPEFAHPQGVKPSYIVSEDHRLNQIFPAEVTAAFRPYRRLLATAIIEVQGHEGLGDLDPDAEAELIQLLQMAMYHVVAEQVESAQNAPPQDALWDFCIGALRRHRKAGRKISPSHH
jgi:AcrR family transcriptional regulator